MTGPRRSRKPKHPLDCHERALRLLAVRPRSRRELETRLSRAGFPADEIDGELERLEAVGLVDDRRFAHEFTEHQLKIKLAGRRAVASALAAKGVDRRTIEETLEEAAVDDEETAAELARARAPRLGGLPPEKAFPRLVSYLVRRGHAADLSRRVAREALTIEPPSAEG